MSSLGVEWHYAFAFVIGTLFTAIGFWLKGIRDRRKIAEEKIEIAEEKRKIREQKKENEGEKVKLEEKKKNLDKKEEEIDKKWALCPKLTEEQMYKAMDVVTKIAEERQVPFYSVLDFIKSESESKRKVSLGTLLSRFNISHTTVSSLCNELQESKLLEVKEDSGNEKIYVLTPLGKEVVERFNAFFCFVIRKDIMMEGA